MARMKCWLRSKTVKSRMMGAAGLAEAFVAGIVVATALGGWMVAAGTPGSSKPTVTHTPNGDYATKFVSCSTQGGPDPIYFSGIFQMTLRGSSGNKGFTVYNDSLDPAKEAFDKYLRQKYSYDKAGVHLTCDTSDTEQKAQEAKQYRESGLKGPREGKIIETDWKYVAGPKLNETALID
jgi:hypothetical protein